MPHEREREGQRECSRYPSRCGYAVQGAGRSWREILNCRERNSLTFVSDIDLHRRAQKKANRVLKSQSTRQHSNNTWILEDFPMCREIGLGRELISAARESEGWTYRNPEGTLIASIKKDDIQLFRFHFQKNLRRHETFIDKKLFAFHETCAFRIGPRCASLTLRNVYQKHGYFLKNSQRSLGVGDSFSLETEWIQKMLKKDHLLSQYGSREICLFLADIELST